jgi:flavin-dependent thymidylate synthase
MKVSLIDYTGCGRGDDAEYAAAILIFTKSTRLEMKPDGFYEILKWPTERKMDELRYMANTIPSSWEFMHYTFMIESVTRAFTHQLVRTRTASFAQQTMRVLNVKGWDYHTGPSVSCNENLTAQYVDSMDAIAADYDRLIEGGAAVEDARGVLPTNILTNIVMGVNMRTMAEMIYKRSSSRTQGEYREVLEAMKTEVLRVHPWASLFFDQDAHRAVSDLEDQIQRYVPALARPHMIKLLDQIRSR